MNLVSNEKTRGTAGLDLEIFSNFFKIYVILEEKDRSLNFKRLVDHFEMSLEEF